MAAAGRPVCFLGSQDGEIGNLIARHGCGAVVQQGDASGLAALLAQWAGDPERVRQMGTPARALWTGSFLRPVRRNGCAAWDKRACRHRPRRRRLASRLQMQAALAIQHERRRTPTAARGAAWVLIGALPVSLLIFRADLIRDLLAAGAQVTAMSAPAESAERAQIESLGCRFVPFPVARMDIRWPTCAR